MPQTKRVRKPRRKSDGSFELPVDCPCCGSSKCDVNSATGKYLCWSCLAGGVAPTSWGYGLSLPFTSSKDGPCGSTASDALPPSLQPGLDHNSLELTEKLPIFALQECMRRRQEPQWLLRRYRVRWSFSRGRLWFPAGDGGVLRSVLSWEDPKTITVVPYGTQKGLVGQHLLDRTLTPGWDTQSCKSENSSTLPPQTQTHVQALPGSGLRVVLTEGDWKCAAIPIPWTGLGLQGKTLSEYQRFVLLAAAPLSIDVMLDGGCENEANKIITSLLPFKAGRVDLPRGAGPDDVPRSELVKSLLESTRRDAGE